MKIPRGWLSGNIRPVSAKYKPRMIFHTMRSARVASYRTQDPLGVRAIQHRELGRSHRCGASPQCARYPISVGSRVGPTLFKPVLTGAFIRGPAKKAILAVAGSMLTAAYFMLRDGVEYQDLGSRHFEQRDKDSSPSGSFSASDLGVAVEVKAA
jgi:hypothetical protein